MGGTTPTCRLRISAESGCRTRPQFDPMPFVDSMIREVDGRGGRLVGALRAGR
jgi:hypothetical protein